MEVDGRRVPVEYAEPFMQPIGPIVATDGAVEMIGTFDLDGGEQTVVIRDGMPTDPFDRTDYSFRARDGAVLVASGLGEEATEALEHASVHRGMPLPGEFMVRVRVPERPRRLQEQVMLVLPWVAGLCIALLLSAALVRFKRRARSLQ